MKTLNYKGLSFQAFNEHESSERNGAHCVLTSCESISQFPDGVVEIPAMIEKYPVVEISTSAPPFKDLDGLTKIILPGSIIAIDKPIAKGCDDLQEIVIGDGTAVVGDVVAEKCSSLNCIEIPNTCINIPGSTAAACKHFIKIRIQDSHPYFIAQNEMIYSKQMTVLAHCNSEAASLTIPDSVTSILRNCFAYQTELKEITLPQKLEQIGFGAFDHCVNLERIDLPDSIENIETAAFSHCESLKEIRIPPKIKSVPDVMCSRCTKLERIIWHDNVKCVGAGSFSGCSSITELNIPSSLKEISGSAFSKIGIKEFTVTSNFTSIAPLAFNGCKELKTVNVEDPKICIHPLIFNGCDNLQINFVKRSV